MPSALLVLPIVEMLTGRRHRPTEDDVVLEEKDDRLGISSWRAERDRGRDLDDTEAESSAPMRAFRSDGSAAVDDNDPLPLSSSPEPETLDEIDANAQHDTDAVTDDYSALRRRGKGNMPSRYSTMSSTLDDLASTRTGPLWRWPRAVKEFVLQTNHDAENPDEFIPNYRWTPILSGAIVPFAILLEIPGELVSMSGGLSVTDDLLLGITEHVSA